MERFKQKLQAEAIPFRENEPLAAHCTFKIGGPAQLFVMPENEQQLCSAVALCKEQAVRYYLLGNGSNILFADEGFSGVVIDVSALDAEIAVEDTVLTAGAGVRLAALCKAALKHGLSGLEFAYGIPGTVGGAVYMNAGAYGGEIAHILVSAQVLTKDGDIRTIDARDMRFGYRRSVLQETGEVVISAKFNLKPGDYEQIKNEMNRLNHLRELKQPLEFPSCGSVFKRPPGHFAGQLIMEANLKGHRIGGVEVSTKHAGFMVNVDQGTAKDYEDLISDVIAKVKENSGVTLEPEVRIIGDELN